MGLTALTEIVGFIPRQVQEIVQAHKIIKMSPDQIIQTHQNLVVDGVETISIKRGNGKSTKFENVTFLPVDSQRVKRFG